MRRNSAGYEHVNGRMRWFVMIHVVIVTMLMVAVGCDAGSSPDVQRVEPPSWWVGHSRNPVRLMLSGENLAGATVDVPKGFAASDVVVNPAGNHLFFNLHIPANAAIGHVELKVRTTRGATPVKFEVMKKLSGSVGFSGFAPDDVIYLIMPDRFCNGDAANDNPSISPGLLNRSRPRDYHGGDLQGVINRLSYLRELGVTALWLTPWYDNVNHPNTREKYTRDNHRSTNGIASTDYHGYGAVDFYAVEERFGDMAKLRELVETAHSIGMKVIQDQVANHTGPYHRWVKSPPTPTWYNGTEQDHLDNSWATWTLTQTNPPQDLLKSTLEGWFINILPDLNQNDPETAAYLIQNSLWWIGKTGVDAVRQDTLPYVPRNYWAQWTRALKAEYPRLSVLGEMFDGNPKLVAFFQGGRKQFDDVDTGIEKLFDFPLHYALRDVFAKRQSMTKIAQVFAADDLYVDANGLVTFIGLHDTSRFMNEPGADVDGLRLAFTCVMTVRGTPMFYYGDEIAMRGGGDPDNRRDFPGGWAEDARNAFEASGRTSDEERVHSHVKRLLALRRELPALRQGRQVQLAGDADTLVYARVLGNSPVIVAFNNGAQARTFEVTLPSELARDGNISDRLQSLGTFTVNGGKVTVSLPARTSAILTYDMPAVAGGEGKPQAKTDLRLLDKGTGNGGE